MLNLIEMNKESIEKSLKNFKCSNDIYGTLLKTGQYLNAKDDEMKTPLHWAVEKNSKEMVELLISKGADINANAKGSWTPLHIAVKNNLREIIELLISKGADLNAQNWDNR